MAGGKQSPRQKMINLMYLVFIAMLAMQIDRQVLRSFENVDLSLSEATKLSGENNASFLETIAEKAKRDPEYAKVFENSKLVKEKSDELFKIIDEYKKRLDTEVGYTLPIPGQETKYNSLSNTDAINKIFFKGDKPSADGERLKAAVDSYRDFIVKNPNLTDENFTKFKTQVQTVFDTSDKDGKSWLTRLLFEQPMIAAKTNLTKIQSDIRTEEGHLVRSFFEKKLLSEIEIKAFQAVAMSPVFLEKGKDSQATIALGAFDNGIKGTAVVNGRSYPLVGGKAMIPISASTKGVYDLKGYIDFVDKNGKSDRAEFEPTKYEVVERVTNTALPPPIPPNGVVTADKMNVVYRGLPNPISASVTGALASSVNLSGPGLSKSGSGWILTPSSGTEVTLNLSGKSEEGLSFSKAFSFRIKNVPAPQGQIRGQNTLTIPASSLANQVVEAKIPDFEWPVNFQVTSCKVKISGKATIMVSGNNLAAVGSAAKSLRAGDVVNVFDIQVVATGLGDQKIRNVSPVAITIQ